MSKEIKVAFIVFWNYNEKASTGLKDCKIYYKNIKVFEGTLHQGSEEATPDYYQIIAFNKSAEEKELIEKLKKMHTENEGFEEDGEEEKQPMKRMH